jgi:hypothetical protein
MSAMDPWFALEAAIAQWDRQEAARQFLASLEVGEDAVPPGVTYGRELYSGCLEPGYRERRQTEFAECPECGRWRCKRDDYERAEGGSLNFYYRLSCDACDFYDTNDDDDW